MEKESLKEYVDNYIDFHSAIEIQERGWELYRGGKVALQFYT